MGITGQPPPVYTSSSNDLLGHDALAGPPAEVPLKKKKRKGLRKLAPAYVLRQTMRGARSAAGDLLGILARAPGAVHSALQLARWKGVASPIHVWAQCSLHCSCQGQWRTACATPERCTAFPAAGTRPDRGTCPAVWQALPQLCRSADSARCDSSRQADALRRCCCRLLGHQVTTTSAGKVDARVKRTSLRRDSVDPIKMAAGAASRETRRCTKELDALVSAAAGAMALAGSRGGSRPKRRPACRTKLLDALLTSASQ